mgnify:CR=1 FL=1
MFIRKDALFDRAVLRIEQKIAYSIKAQASELPGQGGTPGELRGSSALDTNKNEGNHVLFIQSILQNPVSDSRQCGSYSSARCLFTRLPD